MKGENYPYQQDVLDKIITNNLRNVALSFPCGMGKTRVALAWVEHLYKNKDVKLLVVIAPNGVHSQWILEQVPQHMEIKNECLIWKAGRPVRNKCSVFLNGVPYREGLSILSINVETLSVKDSRDFLDTMLSVHPNFAIVLDEATFIKTPKAQRTNGAMRLSALAKYRMFLTASMYIKNVAPAYMCYEFLIPGRYSGKKSLIYHSGYWRRSYNDYMDRYCIMYSPNYMMPRVRAELPAAKAQKIKRTYDRRLEQGDAVLDIIQDLALSYKLPLNDLKTIIKKEKYVPIKNLEEFKSNVEHLTFSADKALLNLPPKVGIKIDCEMGEEVRPLYSQLRKNLRLEYANEILTRQTAMVLVRRLQLLANGIFEYTNMDKSITDPSQKYGRKAVEGFAKLPKTLAICEKIRQIVESGERVIIWAHSPLYLESLAAVWDKHREQDNEYTILDGQVARLNRAMELYKMTKEGDDKPDVVFMSPLIGAFGLNLQDYSNQIWALNSGFLERRYQGEERSHRVGQKSTVFIYDFVILETVESNLYQMNVNGIDLNDKLNSMANLTIEYILS